MAMRHHRSSFLVSHSFACFECQALPVRLCELQRFVNDTLLLLIVSDFRVTLHVRHAIGYLAMNSRSGGNLSVRDDLRIRNLSRYAALQCELILWRYSQAHSQIWVTAKEDSKHVPNLTLVPVGAVE